MKRYPESEAQYDWLKPLLDTYDATDNAIAYGLKNEKRKPACHEGCAECCKSESVPINQHEMAGISWYVTEIMQEQKEAVIRNLEKYRLHQSECPFLVENSCAVYPVRPLACRTHYMLGSACQPGENVTIHRMGDLFRPPLRRLHEAAAPMAGLFGIKGIKKQVKAVSKGFLQNHTMQMHEIDWKEFLLTTMALHNSR